MKEKFFGNQSITGLGEEGAQSETYHLEPSIIFEGLTLVLNSRLQQSIFLNITSHYQFSPLKRRYWAEKC